MYGIRIPHIIAKLRKTVLPSNFLFFDTETRGRPNKDNLGEARHTLFIGCALAFRLENGERTRVNRLQFEDTKSFWKLVRQRISKDRPLYIFSHNLPFDLTITNFWLTAEAKKMRVEFQVLDDPPLIISFIWHDCRVYLVDTLNYWRCSLEKLGESVGLHKTKMPGSYKDKQKWYDYCWNDVEVIATAVESLCRWIKDNDLGTFALTAPSLAYNTFRYRFMKTEVMIHDNVKALLLERGCYYGGLVNCYFIGKAKQQRYYYLDVNSLYPSVMVNDMPLSLEKRLDNPTTKQLLKYHPRYCLAALVHIKTRTNTYPCRVDKRLCEVKGEFDTFLCGPELIKGLKSGDVRSIEYACVYRKGKLFNNYVDFFWKMRKQYQKEGNEVNETFCKLMLNSLYGKFGMKGYEWHDLNKETIEALYKIHRLPVPDVYKRNGWVPKLLWGQHKWYPLGIPEGVTIRANAGKVQIRFYKGEHYESSPIVAAYVTSYARDRLRNLVRTTGKQHCYYVDTDSLFVDSVGYHRLVAAKEINPGELGKLKCKEDGLGLTIYGPKDYVFGDSEVIKGIRSTAFRIADGCYVQNQFEGIRSILSREPSPYIGIKWIVKELSREYNKGLVGKDGWTIPFTLVQGEDRYGQNEIHFSGV